MTRPIDRNVSYGRPKCVYAGICKIPTGSGVMRKFRYFGNFRGKNKKKLYFSYNQNTFE